MAPDGPEKPTWEHAWHCVPMTDGTDLYFKMLSEPAGPLEPPLAAHVSTGPVT